jgi:predicted dehydrogenase
MKKQINVGLIGAQFMGRAHSNAYLKVASAFELPVRPVRRAVCDINPDALDALAARYGWETRETSWEKLVRRDDIDLIDICTANDLHMPIAVAAAKAGKHVLCEKPIARNADEARRMLDAAQEAGVQHMVAFNYRRVPAIALARQLIEQGKIGRIFHFNAVYYQDWLVNPAFPFVWRHDARVAGSGAHGDMNAHIVDLARFLVGEIAAVCGAQEVFTKFRKRADGTLGEVTADDATFALARFRDGALGSFMVTRNATGRKNFMRWELFGSEGSLSFNLERLNELEFYSCRDTESEHGFRKILVTEPAHPFLKPWWPPGHIIGWEHTFIHEIADLLTVIANGKRAKPDFEDGLRCQQVLDAIETSAREKTWVALNQSE